MKIFEFINNAAFWITWIKAFIGGYWLLILLLVGGLWGLFNKAFDIRTFDPAPWKKAFWIGLLIAVGILAWCGIDAYQDAVQAMGQSSQPKFRY